MGKIEEVINKQREQVDYKTDDKGYLDKTIQNILIDENEWESIKVELSKGNGSELNPDNNGVIKFKALHSSSALCVNTFAPFKKFRDRFRFLNHPSFYEASFEKKMKTGISTPNLDFYLENSTTAVGIESKFTEPFSNHHSGFNLDKYIERSELQYLSSEVNKLIESYNDSNDATALDTAQLIKHSIGLINECRDTNKSPVLVYIYWLPTNWYNIDTCLQHEKELRKFKNQMAKVNEISFVSMSYLDFWEQYQVHPLFRDHIINVRDRYEFPLNENL